MHPFIAITVGEIMYNGEPWAPTAYGQARTYVDAVVRAGGVPLIIPLIDDETVLKLLYQQCSGLLLSGGNDLDPTCYKAQAVPSPRVTRPCPRRDKQELKLFNWALADNLPVLGICRGMQIINVGLGGSLHQDIATEFPAASNHELSALRKDIKHMAHTLKIISGSQLANILGTEQIKTNALHHQAIQKLGNGLVAVAHAEDGIIEAIELPDKQFVMGVQSHPEALEAEAEPQWCELFRDFVNSARLA